MSWGKALCPKPIQASSTVVSCIGARAAKPQAESARECRLGPAGIGRSVSARVAPHGTPGCAGEAPGTRSAAIDDPEEPRAALEKIDKIVKFRRGKAESRVPWRPVADHAVGGVDGLVANAARKPPSASQKAGAATPSEKFSARLSIAARATPASSRLATSRPTMFAAASAARLQSRVKRLGDGQDMRVEASLRDEAGSGKRCEGKAGRGREFRCGKRKVEKSGGAPSER